MELAVLTLSVVPPGIVAAFKDDAATQAQVIAITVINFFGSYWFEWLIFQVLTERRRGKGCRGVSYGGASVTIGMVCIGGLISWKMTAATTAAAKSASR